MNVKIYEHDFYYIHFTQGIFKSIGNIGIRKQMKKRNTYVISPNPDRH